MARLRTMYSYILECLKTLRDDAETNTIPFVVESEQQRGTIDVYAEANIGLVCYHIKVKDITVKKVRDEFTENDLVNVASVRGTKIVNKQRICNNPLFHMFAGLKDRINERYGPDLLRYTIQHAIGTTLGLIID